MKRIITKILSIICLLAVLACAFVPCITLTGEYKDLVAGLKGATTGIPEESYEIVEQMLSEQNITIDLKATMDGVTAIFEPLNDGQLSIMEFYTLSEAAKNVATELSALPLEGLNISGDETDPAVMALASISEMISTLAQAGQMLYLASMVLLIPVGLFGLLALAIVIRILLRLFNRRGLGVFITLLAILNGALMIGIPYGINYVVNEQLPIGAEYTMIPVVMVVCCIANCIIWAIGRGAKVKEEVPVPVPVPPAPVEEAVAPVEPTPVEPTPVVEEPIVEETTEKDK